MIDDALLSSTAHATLIRTSGPYPSFVPGNRRPMIFRNIVIQASLSCFLVRIPIESPMLKPIFPCPSTLLLLLIVPSSKNPARNTGYPQNELNHRRSLFYPGQRRLLAAWNSFLSFLFFSSVTGTSLRMSNTGIGVDKSYSGRSGHVLDSLFLTLPSLAATSSSPHRIHSLPALLFPLLLQFQVHSRAIFRGYGFFISLAVAFSIGP
jgi:hypothetical protein